MLPSGRIHTSRAELGQPTLRTNNSKTINVAVDAIKKLSKTLSADVKATALSAQKQREMFSYKFPAQGIPRLVALGLVLGAPHLSFAY